MQLSITLNFSAMETTDSMATEATAVAGGRGDGIHRREGGSDFGGGSSGGGGRRGGGRQHGPPLLTHKPPPPQHLGVRDEEEPGGAADPTRTPPSQQEFQERPNALIDSYELSAAGTALSSPHSAVRDVMPPRAARDDTPDAAGADSSQAHALLSP